MALSAAMSWLRSHASVTLAALLLSAAPALASCRDNADRADSSTPIPATARPTRTVAPPPATAVPHSPTVAAPTATPDSGQPPLAPIPTRVPSGPGTITITAVGDISLARELVPRMQAQGAFYPYALIQPLLDGDIVIGNMEGALTDRGEPWPKGYNFRTPPQFASGLAQAGFDYVSLANNHAMDYGVIGLTDTIAALDAAGVAHGGAGGDLASAIAPDILSANGVSVAVVACALTPDEYGGFSIWQWRAREGHGIAVCNEGDLTEAVRAGKARADFAVVFAHAGSEYITTPDATQRAVAGWAFAAGADAYVGHHAHVVQPIEMAGGRLTAWGLGNFIFDLDEVDLANIPQPRVSLALRFTLTKGAGVTSFEALPVVLDASQDRPRPATVDEAAVLFALIQP